MAASARKACDFLLGEVMFHQGFKTHTTAFTSSSVLQKVDDPFASVFYHKIGKPFFHA